MSTIGYWDKTRFNTHDIACFLRNNRYAMLISEYLFFPVGTILLCGKVCGALCTKTFEIVEQLGWVSWSENVVFESYGVSINNKVPNYYIDGNSLLSMSYDKDLCELSISNDISHTLFDVFRYR